MQNRSMLGQAFIYSSNNTTRKLNVVSMDLINTLGVPSESRHRICLAGKPSSQETTFKSR